MTVLKYILLPLLFQIFYLNLFLSVLLRFQPIGAQAEPLANVYVLYVWYLSDLAPF